MTTARFDYQRSCVEHTSGTVLNVGANEDPAQLRETFGARVINCDIEKHDSYMDRDNDVQCVFDAREEWPFPDDAAELVVLGDILEHLYPPEATKVLAEARRVAQRVCITVPRDTRWQEEGVDERNGYRTHCHEWKYEDLEKMLEDTGWNVAFAAKVDYFFVPEGYFIEAQRA